MIFEMSLTQKQKLDDWQDAIKKVYGQKGNYQYIFTPNGIGYSISVYSELANYELDLTEPENF